MREAVYPTSSPVGVKDELRVDNYYALKTDNYDREPYGTEGVYYDGGFPVGDGESNNLLAMNPGLIHEFGHTCLSLPDLYGYPMARENVFLKDDSGNYFAGGPMMPEVMGGGGSWIYENVRLYLSAPRRMIHARSVMRRS